MQNPYFYSNNPVLSEILQKLAADVKVNTDDIESIKAYLNTLDVETVVKEQIVEMYEDGTLKEILDEIVQDLSDEYKADLKKLILPNFSSIKSAVTRVHRYPSFNGSCFPEQPSISDISSGDLMTHCHGYLNYNNSYYASISVAENSALSILGGGTNYATVRIYTNSYIPTGKFIIECGHAKGLSYLNDKFYIAYSSEYIGPTTDKLVTGVLNRNNVNSLVECNEDGTQRRRIDFTDGRRLIYTTVYKNELYGLTYNDNPDSRVYWVEKINVSNGTKEIVKELNFVVSSDPKPFALSITDYHYWICAESGIGKVYVMDKDSGELIQNYEIDVLDHLYKIQGVESIQVRPNESYMYLGSQGNSCLAPSSQYSVHILSGCYLKQSAWYEQYPENMLRNSDPVTLYVNLSQAFDPDHNTSGVNQGNTKDNACRTLQDAINIAECRPENTFIIKVKDGYNFRGYTRSVYITTTKNLLIQGCDSNWNSSYSAFSAVNEFPTIGNIFVNGGNVQIQYLRIAANNGEMSQNNKHYNIISKNSHVTIYNCALIHTGSNSYETAAGIYGSGSTIIYDFKDGNNKFPGYFDAEIYKTAHSGTPLFDAVESNSTYFYVMSNSHSN